ncbi:MAG: sensor domain-containing diguanylate cyclase [Gammaproteobacteria bacterium]|nr:sensor domain-containing diguanylate cyclase [Gammaproteobacteria bacterium]
MNLDIIKQRATAFDYLFDAVVVTDLRGIIIDWNKGSEKLYGYAKKEAIGQPVNMLHAAEDTESITSEVISAIQKSGQWSGEVRMLHKEGHIGWIESMCVPIFDENKVMTGALGINRDITERKNEIERLKHLAHYDSLTKIPNRSLLFDRVEHLIARSKRDKLTFALFYIDLDNFKNFNDTKGHAYGDQILVEVALCLKQCIRNSDTVARIGGDEFILILENITDKSYIEIMLETISITLKNNLIVDNEKIDVGCSIGFATYPDNGKTMDELLAIADSAMYKIKHNNCDH